MMTQGANAGATYKSLEEIRFRKELLRRDLQESKAAVDTLFRSLFRKEEDETLSPTKRFAGMLTTGAGVIDGLLLGWKVYRKFGGRKKKAG